MIDYTGKAAQQAFPTKDDVLAFSRFVMSASAGNIRLSEAAAADAIGVCSVLAMAEEEHEVGNALPDGLPLRRFLDVAEAALREVARYSAASIIRGEDQGEKLRSIAALAALDIPATDIVYAIRRVLTREEGDRS
jgi:hypothetical protein